MTLKYAGADWVESAERVKCSPLGREVADILGQVFRGLYHLEHCGGFSKTDWANTRFVEVRISGQLATYDAHALTDLVILCHDRRIRLEINPNMRTLLLRFHQRRSRSGGSVWERHPTIEAAIESTRKTIGLGVLN